jgi:hypothetical protein
MRCEAITHRSNGTLPTGSSALNRSDWEPFDLSIDVRNKISLQCARVQQPTSRYREERNPANRAQTARVRQTPPARDVHCRRNHDFAAQHFAPQTDGISKVRVHSVK